ncbi:MAG: V-type ATP synthase subunit E [Cuniculiplasma sp.]
MTAEDIIEELEKKGMEEIQRISADCEKGLYSIVSKSQEKLKAIEQTMERKLDEDIKRIDITSKDEILIATKTVEMERKKVLLNQFWEKVDLLKEEIRKDQKYEEFLKKCLKEARTLMGKKFTVVGAPSDRVLINKMDGDFAFSESEVEMIGIIALSEDGKRSLNMSLNSIISEKRDEIEESILEHMGAH